MKVLEAIKRGSDFLSRKGVEAPRLQTELLLAHILRLPRMRLYLDFERELDASTVENLREFIKRRGSREPLQYILGSTSFCGYEIEVNRHVLIPRPETEVLAEKAWTWLNSVSNAGDGHHRALDFGTGSGCIAVALAKRAPEVAVAALDASDAALELARRNSEKNTVEDRITFLHSDGFSALQTASQGSFSLIVSNPPYIPSGEIAHLQAEVRDYEPRLALEGGIDGLDYYRYLASNAGLFLAPLGKLMLELGDGQAGPVSDLLQREMWVVEEVVEDYTRRPRFLVASRSGTGPTGDQNRESN